MDQFLLLLYDLGIRVYGLLIRIASPFSKKASEWISGRRAWKKRARKNQFVERPAWIHCSSLGEFEQGRPLIDKIKEQFPDIPILLTFYSPSGFKVRQNYGRVDHVDYIPLDSRSNAQFFVKHWDPRIAIFVKYDLWFNHVKSLEDRNIPIYLISAIFSEDDFYFQWYAHPFLEMLHRIDQFFVQDENSRSVLNDHSIDQVSVVGDTRLDRVLQIADRARDVDSIKSFCANEKVIIAGSTWPKDEELLFEWIRQYETSEFDKLLIVPHELKENHLKFIEKNCPRDTVRYSNYSEEDADKVVMIVDKIGILSIIYRYARLAYIGGGFGAGIHNILEAAAYKIPVIFGPNYEKFKEAHDFIEMEVAQSVSSAEETQNAVHFLLKKQERGWIDKQLEDYFTSSGGATNLIFEFIDDHFEEVQ
jgi:3-deoxy-D-manno-octulosonic-acid transferase